jgi:Type IV secretion system pilin
MRAPYFLLAAVLLAGALSAAPAHAVTWDDFVPLVRDIPLVTDATDLTGLINAFVGIAVGAAALLAVVMFALGGMKYMMSEAAFSKSDAKEQMTEALVGLAIVLGSFLILNVINEDLTSLNALRNTQAIPAPGAPSTAPASVTAPGQNSVWSRAAIPPGCTGPDCSCSPATTPRTTVVLNTGTVPPSCIYTFTNSAAGI